VADPLLERAISRALADPTALMRLVPLTCSPADLERTRRALVVLFGRARLGALGVEGADGQGRYQSVHARLTDIDLYGLRIAEVEAHLSGVRLDMRALAAGALELAGEAPVKLVARVEEPDLSRMSRGGSIGLTARGMTIVQRPQGLIGATARLEARVDSNPKNQLVLVPRALSYGIVPIPGILYRQRIERMNPLFDLDKFLGSTKASFDVRFGAVTTERGAMTVTIEGSLRRPSTAAATVHR
jgi:hypothetical protein